MGERQRPLHVGIDGRELVGKVTGVGRYLAGVLGEWTRDAGFPHRLSVLVPRAPRDPEAFGPGLSWVVVPSASQGSRWEQFQLPGALRRAGVDVLFAPAYTAPLWAPCPTVVVIHDVSFAAHPEWFSWRDGLRRRWLTRATARRAARILTVSEFSASEIVRWLGVARSRIDLAPPAGPAAATASPAGVARDPVVLFVGSLFNRRHIETLIEAFAEVAPTVAGSRLVLVGDNRTHPPVDPRAVAARLGLEARVTWHDYVSDDVLESLYASAAVFAFLSDYEGFGIPPLEAIAHGVPPVLLDTAVSREIYGEAAVLVGREVPTIADGLRRLLTDAGLRRERLAAGRALLDRYTWSRAAVTVRRALEEAAG